MPFLDFYRWSAGKSRNSTVSKLRLLKYTTYVVAVVAIVVVGIQARPIPVQVVAIRAIVRGSRPPVPVPGIVDGAIVVVATGNRAKSGITSIAFLANDFVFYESGVRGQLLLAVSAITMELLDILIFKQSQNGQRITLDKRLALGRRTKGSGLYRIASFRGYPRPPPILCDSLKKNSVMLVSFASRG